MSGFDVSVWYSGSHLTPAQATQIVQHVGSDWVIFAHDPHVEGSLTALRQRYPDFAPGSAASQYAQWGQTDPFLQSIDDPRPPPPKRSDASLLTFSASSVWASTPISQQGLFLAMSVSWEQVAKVGPYIQALAKNYHLTVFDEHGHLDQPPQSPMAGEPAEMRLSLTLHTSGRMPVLNASVTEGNMILAQEVVPTRLAAHMLARSMAVSHDEIGYHVDDPRSSKLSTYYQLQAA